MENITVSSEYLTLIQKEALKQNFGIIAQGMKAKDILPVLRKKLKKYKFKKVIILQ